VRLRTDDDGNYATYDYQLMQQVTGGDGSGDKSGDGSRMDYRVMGSAHVTDQ